MLLRPRGTLDVESCWILRQQLATAFSAGVSSIAVDLSAVSEVDVTGLQVLAGAARHLRKRNGAFAVTGASPAVAKQLRINGMAELLEVPASTPLRVVSDEGTDEPVSLGRRLRVVPPSSSASPGPA